MRSIFYASSKEKAKEFFAQFKDRWEKDVPSAVKMPGKLPGRMFNIFQVSSGGMAGTPDDEYH